MSAALELRADPRPHLAPLLSITRDDHDVLVDRLALSVKMGDARALARLYDCLRPIIHAALAGQTARGRLRGLPGSLEPDDLGQEAWLILEHLTQTWRPEGGAFGAYVRVSLPWALARYVARQSHARRSNRIEVLSYTQDRMQELAQTICGDDGRQWGRRLALADALGSLTDQERAVVLAIVAHGQPVTDIARRLGVSRYVVQRLHRQGLAKLRAEWTSEAAPSDTREAECNTAAERDRLLRALVAGATPDGTVPGRTWVCARAGLSQPAYGRLMAQLVDEGLIVGRRRKVPGHLSPAAVREARTTRTVADLASRHEVGAFVSVVDQMLGPAPLPKPHLKPVPRLGGVPIKRSSRRHSLMRRLLSVLLWEGPDLHTPPRVARLRERTKLQPWEILMLLKRLTRAGVISGRRRGVLGRIDHAAYMRFER